MVRHESCGVSIFSDIFPILLADGRYVGITIGMIKNSKRKYWNFTRNCSRVLSLYTVPSKSIII